MLGCVGARTPGKHGRRSASTAAASAARTPTGHGRAAGTHFGTAARPQIATPIMVQVSQHSSKQTWQEVSRHSSRHSKDTNIHQPAGATQPWQQGPNLGHLGQQQPVQQGHPPNTAAFATLQQGLFLRHRPNTAAGQPVQQGLAWESSQCSKRGQTQGQASQHSSIWRRTWDAHQACHHSSSNLHLTLYWPGFLSPCGFTNTWQYQ